MDNATTSQQKQAAKRPPFCFQEKERLRTIRDVFENRSGLKSSAIALYVALTEIASDYQSNTFTVSQTAIANRAGLTDRTLRSILPVFQQLGYVTVQRNYVDGLERQSTYCLNREPLGKFCRTPGKEFQNHFPTSEEFPEQSPDDNAQQSSSIPSLEEALRQPLWKKLARQYVRFCESRPGGSPTKKGWKTWASKQLPPKPKPNRDDQATPPPPISDAEHAATLACFKASNRKAFPEMRSD